MEVDTALSNAASSETLFAADLVAALAAAGDGNLVVSPPSVFDALARLAPGARGATAEALARVLRGVVLADVAQLGRELNSDDATLRIASAAWLQDGYPVVDAYRTLLAQAGSPLRRADFAGDPQRCRAVINAWIEDNTAGRIRDLLTPGSIDATMRLALANAVALDACWARPFDEAATGDAPFHTPSATRTVPTMHRSALLPYLDAPGCRAVRLAYSGGRLGAVVALPDKGADPIVALPALSRAFESRQVELALPRFEASQDVALRQPLAALGLAALFQKGVPDLSGIGGAPGELHVSAAQHRAWLSVDEAGTKGAAATAFGVIQVRAVVSSKPPVDFTVDRPFLFVVEDTAHRVPLFVARIVDPS